MMEHLIIFDLDDTLYDCSGFFPVGKDESLLKLITPLPGVKEFLTNFSGKKILLSKGDPFWQSAKLKSLNLQDSFHQVIICSSNADKKTYLQKIMSEFPGQKIIVIGDRIDSEIRYANELGLTTVHIKRGKYKNLKAQDNYEIPTYQISDFKELKDLL